MDARAALQSEDFYARLGVDSSASTDEIKRAYKNLLRQFPPDRAPDEFKRLRQAYETLSDPRSRTEYDRRPDPVIAQWLATGHQAMKAEDYALAERYFKQVLLREPDLGFVRNLLGLCFLYQEEPAKAVAQFERLLVEPDAPAVWFANAGHGYRQLNRYADAERAFLEAARRATDNPVDYIVALADVYAAQDHFDTAAKVLDEGINADGSVDFQDLGYFIKLLEIRTRERSIGEVEKVLVRVRRIATDDEQRKYLAWKLGTLGQQLIAVGAFQYAAPLARLARHMQPEDEDYFALEKAATVLQARDFVAAEQLIGTHESFGAGGWLVHLAKPIREYIRDNRVFAELKKIDAAPSLGTVNGIGTALYGSRDYDAPTGSYIATLYFVVLFIPIVPIACYRVIPAGPNRWRFLGKVPYSKRETRHWKAFAAAIVILAFFANWWPDSAANTRVDTNVVSTPTSGGGAGLQLTPAPLATSSGSNDAQPRENQPQIGGPVATQTRTNDEGWYEAERLRIRSMEGRIRSLDDQIEADKAELESQERQIRSVEAGFSTYSIKDPEYDQHIRKYNLGVNAYNELLARRRELYRTYKSALDAFNARVAAHNLSLRR